DGRTLEAFRFVSGTDLGGIVLVPGTEAPGVAGRLTLTLDSTPYASAEILELATGQSARFPVSTETVPIRLSLSLAKGPLGIRLTARAVVAGEAAAAAVGVSERRGLTAEDILAKHQAWRAARD